MDLLEQWIQEVEIRREMPRNMQFIREDIIRSVKENPVFDFLKEEKRISYPYKKDLKTC